MSDSPAAPTRPRDAAATRQLLVDAAQQLFSRDGYQATGVRSISDLAGVNVALINRYFGSKVGLYRASLQGGDAFPARSDIPLDIDDFTSLLADELTGPHPNRLAMLMRPSTDREAEQVRMQHLRGVADVIAAVTAGWRHHPLDEQELLLRAELVLATIIGTFALRSATSLDPIAHVDRAQLRTPLRALLVAVLGDGRG
jgi:AcrR family transcriptional regulator